MKICKTCGIQKELSFFSPNKSCSQGRLNSCKACVAAKRRENYKNNPEKYKESVKKYAKNNCDKVLTRNRQYREKNPEKVKNWKKKDRQNHKHRIAADNAKRRSLLAGKVDSEIVMVYVLRDFYRAMSLGEDFHVDHIIPLSKGGLHTAENLQVIPAIDNLRKGNKL